MPYGVPYRDACRLSAHRRSGQPDQWTEPAQSAVRLNLEARLRGHSDEGTQVVAHRSRRDVGSASVSIQPETAPPGAVSGRSSELSHYRVLAASRRAVRLPDAPSMGVVLSASSNYGNVPLARIHGTRCSITSMRTACNRRGAIGEQSRVADTGRSQCWRAPGVVLGGRLALKERSEANSNDHSGRAAPAWVALLPERAGRSVALTSQLSCGK